MSESKTGDTFIHAGEIHKVYSGPPPSPSDDVWSVNMGLPPQKITVISGLPPTKDVETVSRYETLTQIDENLIMYNIAEGVIVSQTPHSVLIDTPKHTIYLYNRGKNEDVGSVSEDTVGASCDKQGNLVFMVADGIGSSFFAQYSSRAVVSAQLKSQNLISPQDLAKQANRGWHEYGSQKVKQVGQKFPPMYGDVIQKKFTNQPSQTTFSRLSIKGGVIDHLHLGDACLTTIDENGDPTSFSNKNSNNPKGYISSSGQAVGQIIRRETKGLPRAILLYTDGLLDTPQTLNEVTYLVASGNLELIDKILEKGVLKDDRGIVIVIPKNK